ncbi:membrane protein [Thermococcus guaymasensis DSM 11113]|uniref:Membrane protein n=1 Tax=Thermococcus guaymasensis DSM 11113 TaxID=1432656 RepID=A0A0X1KLC2_9EURY|nr:DUF1648 domain-containing protein [Thermococcus guaymasensis]AJC72064.1 membrane protein [Thermococcus guaymasensis DSM 11113]
MSETAFEMFVSLALLLGGLLALAFRKRRNPLIGFRVGYTYHSERVWEKVNTFAGIFSIVYSLFLLALALYGVSKDVFTLVVGMFAITQMFLGLRMAKREYEIEEFSEEAPEKPPRTSKTEGASIKPYLLTQLGFLAFYLLLVALLWDRLPERIATHFNASGEPDDYSSRLWGAIGVPVLVWLLPLVLTLPAKEPGFFARANFYPRSLRMWCLFTTVLSGGMVLVITIALLYNAGFVSSSAISYGAYLFLGTLVFATYRLLTVGKDERV